ncbi:MAG: hypothetical protein AABZ85_00055, partial [Thermodesulfobacteriota bacterium]
LSRVLKLNMDELETEEDAWACLHEAIQYAKTRKQFGKNIGSFYEGTSEVQRIVIAREVMQD